MAVGRVKWRRRGPRRAAGRLVWVSLLAVVIGGPVWLIFGNEPRTDSMGAINPFALVVPAVATIFALALIPQVLALLRRPVVAADHYALTVRPGVARTLVLPWVDVAEIAIMTIEGEGYLLIRCRPLRQRPGDRPRWCDQGHLRSARRGAPAVAAYDLAAPTDDFVGTPEELLSELAPYIPESVTVAIRAPR